MKRTIRLTESELRNMITQSVKRVLKEGWVGQQVESSEDILHDIVCSFKSKEEIEAKAKRNGCGSVYEYLADFIRDYYDVTLKQCDEICSMVREYYGIDKFYYGE